ncbi:venom acid phosphatase Acph-1-like isoform X3 [Apis dorsata]|nr:venom acid phosphatase Acph-1-like isoform X3 [Apis dorsata]XP_031365173.1 venom acid phosphatase Acph-1-like isoform X3 [Apis dorsata]XP_031365176.1 venom acid phosphatase Acph-1-like isoform X3 [Apis dorsata]
MDTTWTLRFIVCLLCCRASLAELKLVQTIFRHGNKMPSNINFYPNDPYINYTYEPAGEGGLTNVGKMTMYKVGQFFRERYEDFLGEIYTKENILFRSDEVDRTVMSGQLVAAGLYPPSKEQRWNPDLNWQPIPVWTIPRTIDCLYNTQFSPRFDMLRNIVEETDKDVIQFEKDNRDVYKYLSEHTGGNITQSKVFSLYQHLFDQNNIGLELPEWTKSVFPHGKLDELAIYDILIRTRTLESKQISGGIWIREWLNHVDDYISKKDRRKAFMYAAHDLNIACILSALGNFNNEIPYYGNSLMFELHKDDNEYYVQVLYKDKDNIRVLKFPNCDKMCPLNEFKKFVEPLISINMEEICGQKKRSIYVFS